MTALYAFLTGCVGALGLGFLLVRHGREGERTRQERDDLADQIETEDAVNEAADAYGDDPDLARRFLHERGRRDRRS